jgi:23S rRNA (cytosine1962-C5)-methyltransferase
VAFEPLAEPWLDARVLACDRELLVVDKPPGIVVHGGDEERGDDVVHRLRSWLGARGEDSYLGVHQRLDKDASGVLLLTRRRESNRAVAEEMEGHGAEKDYLAVVSGRRLDDAGRFEHRLEHVRGDKTHVVAQGGQLARARYRVLARRGARMLIELRPETGRTHQLRAQLAAAGAPIVGDRLYGGEPGLRLCLHARALALPSLGRRFEAPAPPVFARELAGDSDALGSTVELAGALTDAAVLRWSLFRRGSAFRLANAAGDGVPGVTLDRYGDFGVLSLSSEAAITRSRELAQIALALGARGVYLKLHERGDLRHLDASALAPPEPVAGEPAPAALGVHEGDLRFEVRLGDGLSTGLFLDQRENRALLRQLSAGCRVLNLFSYTCSFSVAAGRGGASEVVSVDLSAPALERGRSAFVSNGLDPKRHRFVRADCITWLRRARRKGERFELIVLDPPSFGTRGKRSTFDVASGYVALAADALGLLVPGGHLLAVTNHRKTSRARLRRMLHDAARSAGRGVSQLKDLPTPIDFPTAPGHPEATKSLLLRVL